MLTVGLNGADILMRLPSMRPLFTSAYHASLHLSKHIFPSQYQLCNIYTAPFMLCGVGKMLPDWLNREGEIRKSGPVKTPDRLKPLCKEDAIVGTMVEKVEKVNAIRLLNRHCPSQVRAL